MESIEWKTPAHFINYVLGGPREAIGDVEMFSPAGLKRVMYEAKNHELPSTEFWKEITRFRTVRAASPIVTAVFLVAGLWLAVS